MKIYQMPRLSGKTEYLIRQAKYLSNYETRDVALIGCDTKSGHVERMNEQIDPDEEYGTIPEYNMLDIVQGKVHFDQMTPVFIDDMDIVITQLFNYYNLKPICGVYTDEGEPDTTTENML